MGGALWDGVLALDVAVLTDAGPLKLDLRLATSVWQPWGPSKICHGYDSLWWAKAEERQVALVETATFAPTTG